MIPTSIHQRNGELACLRDGFTLSTIAFFPTSVKMVKDPNKTPSAMPTILDEIVATKRAEIDRDLVVVCDAVVAAST